jgi:adenylate cyclase class 2
MPRSTREIEVKLPFPTANEASGRLREIGARPVSPRVFEDNLVLDDDERSLERAGRLLRLRTAGSTCTVTFKESPERETRYKVRGELEVQVDDPEAARGLLESLGFRPVWRYQKFRSTFSWEGIEATVDETPIGCWVELEGEPGSIDRAARALRFRPEEYVTSSYGDLAREEAVRTGRSLQDILVFGSAAEREEP